MEPNGITEFLYFCQWLASCKRLHKRTIPDVVAPFYQSSGSFLRQSSPLVFCWTNIDFSELLDNNLEDTSPIVRQTSVTETPLCLLETYLFKDHRQLPWSPILCSNCTVTSIGNFLQFWRLVKIQQTVISEKQKNKAHKAENPASQHHCQTWKPDIFFNVPVTH